MMVMMPLRMPVPAMAGITGRMIAEMVSKMPPMRIFFFFSAVASSMIKPTLLMMAL